MSMEMGSQNVLKTFIGTFKYKVPLEEANEKVETMDEERSEKLNRVKIVEMEKQSLEVACQ